MDLKDSMLGPFMLLALRGESSFIQVSGFVVEDMSKALISGCLKIILIRFPRNLRSLDENYLLQSKLLQATTSEIHWSQLKLLGIYKKGLSYAIM